MYDLCVPVLYCTSLFKQNYLSIHTQKDHLKISELNDSYVKSTPFCLDGMYVLYNCTAVLNSIQREYSAAVESGLICFLVHNFT